MKPRELEVVPRKQIGSGTRRSEHNSSKFAHASTKINSRALSRRAFFKIPESRSTLADEPRAHSLSYALHEYGIDQVAR